MEIKIIPCLSDNYAYFLIDDNQRDCVVVDPGEGEPILRALEEFKLKPTAIWNTHHHPDHCGGNAEVLQRYPGIPVLAHESDKPRIPGMTRGVSHGDAVEFGRVSATIVHNPGHTSGAISYWVKGAGAHGVDAVFTGDTLFAAGCGRVFEGTPDQMLASLDKLAALPATALVYCGHEYTVSNLQWASDCEPDNIDVQNRLKKAASLRQQNLPTLPSSLGEELATNPFLRVDEPALWHFAHAEQKSEAERRVATFAFLREHKNSWRPS